MARQSSEREDLMAEAITLVPRVQFTLVESRRQVVAGQRVDGRWSIFLDGDPVYQFDRLHRLRRAFVDGNLYRTQTDTLARLTRQESAAATTLLRHDLTESELADFFQRMCAELGAIRRAIHSGEIQDLQTIPDNTDFLPQLADGMNHVLNAGPVLAPAITKR